MSDTTTAPETATRERTAAGQGRNQHGDFIWYELLAGDTEASVEFYGTLIGWKARDAGMPDMRYTLLTSPEGIDVGGLLALTDEMKAGGARPGWLGYVGVDDVDKAAEAIAKAGGAVHMPPTDIPGVGRFAMVADPQGAPFYVMRGASDEPSLAFASDRPRVGHCAWNELSTADPDAAKRLYRDIFGWAKDGEMTMGELGVYEFWRNKSGLLGAVMPLMPGQPVSAWGFYFRVPDIDAAAKTITARGGTIIQGPMEIPGGEFSINASDPQGAYFGLVGPRK